MLGKKDTRHKNKPNKFDFYKVLNENLDEQTIKPLFQKFLKKNISRISLQFLEFIKKADIKIPDSVFNKKLTILESIVKFTKENLNLSLSNIADLTNRDKRNIWHAYDNCKKKLPQKFIIEESEFLIPISIFASRKLSVLENLVFYLKQEFNLSYHKIATIIKRDDRTIWAVYQKAKKKHEKK